MAADPIWVGGVYIESDIGSDLHGDIFHVTFSGGAPGTKLTRLTFDTDLGTPGFSLGDLFFDTVESGYGADHAYPFEIIQMTTADPTATVTATVQDGGTSLILDFTNFKAGDKLVFTIDVDEVQFFDPSETDLATVNSNFDPITSGVEFQNSKLKAEFSAPHYEIANGTDKFLNVYDPKLQPSGLPLPADNADGKRDRSAGAVFQLQQVPKPISISGTVFEDNNSDLVIQTGEPRLAGVGIELFQLVNGNYVTTGKTTTTDAQGRYTFGTSLGLMPGTYQVRETQPAGYFSVGAAPGKLDGSGTVGQIVSGNPDVLTTIVIPLGDQHATELNFGEIRPVSISGMVCVSEGGFSCFDASATKSPLSGAIVQLRDSSGNVVATQTSAADGKYSFTNLRPGTYSLVEFTPAELLDGAAKSGSSGGQVINPGEIRQITLTGGVQATGYDFCELVPSDISGYTYFDRDNDGRRDVGETPLANVLVTLWDSAGTKVAETRTDAQGFYKFTRLAPGEYRVTEVTPTGYLPGKAAVGTISGQTVGRNDATGDVLSEVRLPSGRSGINYDFGELLPGSISGHVMVDTDGNCIVDAVGDRYLGGVRIELLDAQGNLLQATTTGANGLYKFENLPIGTYTVREIQPAGMLQAGQKAGSGGGNASVQDVISEIVVGAGDHFIDYDFCEIPPSDLSGHVFVDKDQDCIFDSDESPIAGVTVLLLDQQGNILATTQTDSNGLYRFGNLRPGVYTVREVQPAGYFQGGQRAGSGGGIDLVQDQISAIAIGAGVSLVDYDFCERLPASIAGKVFADLNLDCVHDANESPIAGVTIELLNANGVVLATAKTDANGRYRFENLEPGDYTVREIQPVGYFHVGQMAPATGGNATVDDVISEILLTSGLAITDADFCDVPPTKISGYVFQDGPTIQNSTGQLPEDIRSIRDGLRTNDDMPISGVRLQLRFVSGLPVDSSLALPGTYSTQYVEVMTDANGYFEFNGLRESSYHIYQVQPNGFLDSLDTAGSTGGFGVNRDEIIPDAIRFLLLDDPIADPRFDAILMVQAIYGQESQENNFSEVKVERLSPQAPPPESPVFERRVDYPTPPTYAPVAPISSNPLLWSPTPLLVGVGHDAPPTWHLSIINGGFPRGRRNGNPIAEPEVANSANHLNVYAWTVRGLKQSTWKIVSLNPQPKTMGSRHVFDLPGAQPLAGDFNGDSYDEIALFIDGEWFIDLNSNCRWDEADIWLKLGHRGDQPVVGDWDGDGKDDVGVFGTKWTGDDRALAAEPGLPDPQNLRRIKPKNMPPRREEAPDESRLLQRSHLGPARADLIDHVFLFGGSRDIAISGDFNGDGISTIGVFRDGTWTLDIDGDGLLSPLHDKQVEFGQSGDLPLVGDFNGDGVEELAVVRGDKVYVDSNGNGHIDATDQVFQMESEDGTVIVGDFDGDGRDEPALHQSAERIRTAKRAG